MLESVSYRPGFRDQRAHTPGHRRNLHRQHSTRIAVELVGYLAVGLDPHAFRPDTPTIFPLRMPASQDPGQVSQAMCQGTTLKQAHIDQAVGAHRIRDDP